MGANSLPAGSGLVLVGYRASGKTTVGRIVAERLGRPFLDADAELERRSGRSVSDLFRAEGEPAFRDREEATLRDLCREHPGAVLATGGGAILRESNRRAIADHGTVVWLSAPAEILVERLRADDGHRPALTAAGLLDEVACVVQAREPSYREVADVIVDATMPDPLRIAEAVLRAIAIELEAGR